MLSPEKAPGRLRIKICGITHPEDAALAAELGVDALGLNFYPGSPRCLDPATDGPWLRELPARVLRVAVVVNATREHIERLVGEGLVDAVQLHGDEDAAFCHRLTEAAIPFIRAVRVRGEESLSAIETHGASHLLLDAHRPDAYGGTGQTVDWELAARFVAAHPLTILAGGLHPGNVAEAVARVRPFGIDVASGVEGTAGPRRKDAAKMRAFVAAARASGG